MLTNLIGRKEEQKEILKLLSNERLVWVEGPSGYGKSHLVQEITRHVYNRDVFEDGVLYLSLWDCPLYEGMLKKLNEILAANLTENQYYNRKGALPEINTMDVFDEYLEMIKEFNCLLVFDDWDQIISNDINLFMDFIRKSTCSNIVQRLWSRRWLGPSSSSLQKHVSSSKHSNLMNQISQG
jgi:ATP/maltotriose-dependent transcriptional regulator MalT